MRTRLRSMKRRHGILELLEPRVLMDGENYLHIIWKGADYTDPITHQIILQNSDITGITFNMFAGQLISLGCDSNVPDPSPGPIYNVYWDLGYHA